MARGERKIQTSVQLSRALLEALDKALEPEVEEWELDRRGCKRPGRHKPGRQTVLEKVAWVGLELLGLGPDGSDAKDPWAHARAFIRKGEPGVCMSLGPEMGEPPADLLPEGWTINVWADGSRILESPPVPFKPRPGW